MPDQTRLAMRRLHRQRRRRAAPTIMNQAELAAHFSVPESQVKAALQAASWNFHEDANGALWASVKPEPGGN